MIKKAFLTLAALCVLMGIYLTWIHQTLPDANLLSKCLTTKMNKVYLCPASRDYVKLDNVSTHLKNAILISEDYSFYSHDGFDFAELWNSFTRNLSEFRFARGGSTISQQLTKNVFLTPEKSIHRKVKEALIARKIEKKFAKNLIFERYLNVVEFGKDLYGIKNASWHYFNKPASALNVLESAFLAMLLPNPIQYSQSFRDGRLTEFAKNRVKTICRKLKNAKKISEDAYELALVYLDEFPWQGLVIDPNPPLFEL